MTLMLSSSDYGSREFRGHHTHFCRPAPRTSRSVPVPWRGSVHPLAHPRQLRPYPNGSRRVIRESVPPRAREITPSAPEVAGVRPPPPASVFPLDSRLRPAGYSPLTHEEARREPWHPAIGLAGPPPAGSRPRERAPSCRALEKQIPITSSLRRVKSSASSAERTELTLNWG